MWEVGLAWQQGRKQATWEPDTGRKRAAAHFILMCLSPSHPPAHPPSLAALPTPPCGRPFSPVPPVLQLGAGMRYIDCGGGLAVDYDGSFTDSAASMSYTLQHYANDGEAAACVCGGAGGWVWLL